jgi:hypothetical protein
MTTINTNNTNNTNATVLLANATIDEIEVKLMTILLNNEDKLFYGQYLYNLLLNKYNYKSGSVDPNFKNKYLLVLRNLDANENVKVFKNNNVYKIVYTTKPELYNAEMTGFEDKTQSTNYVECAYVPSDVYRYVETSLPEEIPNARSYVDIENGNTIYHDLVREGSVDILKKMFDAENMNINVSNKDGLTPIDYINDMVVARLFIKELNKQLNTVSKEIETINNEKAIIEVKLNKQQGELRQFLGVFYAAILTALLSYLFKLFM